MMYLKEGISLQGGRYRIEKVLGQGGFGITYLGIQVGLNRQVAIKEFFMKEYCNREEETSHISVPSVGSKELVKRFRQKFVKEAQTISELDNRHIVRIHDVFEENETAYYVMEYLPGGDLRSRIPKSGMSETEALSYIRQIADALMFVHERNILHLDIKPSNVLFRSNGEAVLVDFGLSKHYDETSGDQTSSTPLGISEGYAPTEQYECGGVSSFSPATDIYSLGATLYCLLQGSRPPKASIVLNDGLPALPSRISVSTRKAIETAMQSRRKARPQAVNAFLSLLDVPSVVVEEDKEKTVVDVVFPSVNNSVETLKDEVSSTTPFYVATFPSGATIYLDDKRVGISPLQGKEISRGNHVVKLLLDGYEPFTKQYVFDANPIVVNKNLVAIRSSASEESSKSAQTVVSTTGIINGHEWVDLGLSVKWATANVGASRSSDYGDYFAWGEVYPKSEYTGENNKTYKKSMGVICGNSQYDAACYHWGDSWRLPTEKELRELQEKCRWMMTIENGHKGYKVVGPNGNSIFLPVAGYRSGTSAHDVRTNGSYWSGSPYGNSTHDACSLLFYAAGRNVGWFNRSYGRSVRPVLKKMNETNLVLTGNTNRNTNGNTNGHDGSIESSVWFVLLRFVVGIFCRNIFLILLVIMADPNLSPIELPWWYNIIAGVAALILIGRIVSFFDIGEK